MATTRSKYQGKYISIVGPIGVGKTSFARLVAKRLGAAFVPETFQDNRFLQRLYEPGGIERWGLACELDFLPTRYEQACEINELLESGETVVTDWVFEQNLVFSRITLNDADFDAYKKVFGRLSATTPQPSFMLGLDAETSELMRRIASRGRDMENGIEFSYLDQVRNGYLEWKEASLVKNSLWLDTTNLPIPFCMKAQEQALEPIWDFLGFCQLPLKEQVAV